MYSSPRKLSPGLLAALALLAAACTQSENSDPSIPSSVPEVETSHDPESTPIPVAELVLPNGNNLEFYDFGSGVLITESGVAGTAPGVTAANSPRVLEKQAAVEDRLAAIWRGLAQGKPVPKALMDIQARWRNTDLRPKDAGTRAPTLEFSGIPMGPQAGQTSALGKTAAPNGCNNGCCDYQWLATFDECKRSLDYGWFLYNYGYTYANVDDVDVFSGMVCAASGNSQWKVRMGDGKGGTWTVIPAHYKTWWWVYGWFDEDLRSSVNSATSQALHTYCGHTLR